MFGVTATDLQNRLGLALKDELVRTKDGVLLSPNIRIMLFQAVSVTSDRVWKLLH